MFCLKETANYKFENGVLTFEPNVKTIERINQNVFNTMYKDKVKKIIIPEGIVNIGPSAFKDYENLETVILPKSLEKIECTAFMNCEKLTDIKLPSNLKIINTGAFNGCHSLENIEFPDSLESVSSLVLYDTKYFENQDNWSGLALYNGKHLLFVDESVCGDFEVAEGTKTIAGYAFAQCPDLIEVIIPNSVVDIGEYAMSECQSLEKVFLPNKLSILKEGLFAQDEMLKIVSIPESVQKIEENVFTSCSNMEEVYIFDLSKWCKIDFYDESSVPFIYSTNLYLNDKLIENLVIPEDVNEISNYAFSFCRTMESVTIPPTVKCIHESAFLSNSVKNVYISDLSEWFKLKFANSTANPLSAGCTLYLNEKPITDLVIPDKISEIKDYTFCGCNSLNNVIINSHIKNIGEWSFAYCKNLKTVKIHDGLKEIPHHAFAHSEKLSTIYLPMSIENICPAAFDCCNRMLIKCGKNKMVADWATEHGFSLRISEIDAFLDSVSENQQIK